MTASLSEIAAAQPAAAPPRDGRFAANLLAWFDHSGRKHLPWQHQPTPYRVWVSEIMLQQTQVATVIDYYQRFMARFPDVRALAAADEDEVLHLWTGLGYYARARNLLKAARLVVSEHGGEFPQDIEQVQALPGIGRSTAGAILALSRGQRHSILDGNVKRVLTRYFGIEGFPGITAIERELWTLADACTPRARVAEYTQAIMDLGATVCVRSRPLCMVCPMREDCVARREGRQAVLPTPRPRKERPLRNSVALILQRDDGTVLLEKRPPTGLWGGLWTFPQFDSPAEATAWLALRFPGQAQAPQMLAPYAHAFTHFDLHLQPMLVQLRRAAPAVNEVQEHCWYDAHRPARIGLTKPAVALIDALQRADMKWDE